jgi:predicted NACHT family NTPase
MLGRSNSVPLDEIFTDVYLLDSVTALRHFDIETLKAINKDPESIGHEVKRYDAMELVSKKASRDLSILRIFERQKTTLNKRLFILGRPGSGKTTLLKYLALQAANGVLDKVPIFVSLKEWDDSGLALFPFLVKQFEICDFPDSDLFLKYLLKHDYAIVLFDGLDEVKQEAKKREKMIADLRDFSKQYWETQCLITCRIAATNYSFEHFEYLELADFTRGQIDQYIAKWFDSDQKKIDLFQQEFSNKVLPKTNGEVGFASASFDPVTLELTLLFHPMGRGIRSAWPSERQAREWSDLDKYLLHCPIPEFVRACREWAMAVCPGAREIYSNVSAYSVRQLKYLDTDHDLASALISSAISSFYNS